MYCILKLFWFTRADNYLFLDRPGLRNVEQIEKLQNKLTESLQTVINTNHKEDTTLFAKLLMKTTDLRTLNTLHSEKSIGKFLFLLPIYEHWILKTRKSMAARFTADRLRNTSSVGDILQHLNWWSLEERRKDAWLVLMYWITNKNMAITKKTDLSYPWDNHRTCFHHLSLLFLYHSTKTRVVLEPAATAYNLKLSRFVETFKAATLLY